VGVKYVSNIEKRRQCFFATSERPTGHLASLARLQRAQSPVRKCPASPEDEVSFRQRNYARRSAHCFLLSVNGSQFVSSSIVVINGTTLSTEVTSSKRLQVTITTALISSPGTASVMVTTPSGSTGRSWLHEWWNESRLRHDYYLSRSKSAASELLGRGISERDVKFTLRTCIVSAHRALLSSSHSCVSLQLRQSMSPCLGRSYGKVHHKQFQTELLSCLRDA
jgi:hypothetical protein